MKEVDLPEGEYKVVIVNDPRKEENNQKVANIGSLTNKKEL